MTIFVAVRTHYVTSTVQSSFAVYDGSYRRTPVNYTFNQLQASGNDKSAKVAQDPTTPNIIVLDCYQPTDLTNARAVTTAAAVKIVSWPSPPLPH